MIYQEYNINIKRKARYWYYQKYRYFFPPLSRTGKLLLYIFCEKWERWDRSWNLPMHCWSYFCLQTRNTHVERRSLKFDFTWPKRSHLAQFCVKQISPWSKKNILTCKTLSIRAYRMCKQTCNVTQTWHDYFIWISESRPMNVTGNVWCELFTMNQILSVFWQTQRVFMMMSGTQFWLLVQCGWMKPSQWLCLQKYGHNGTQHRYVSKEAKVGQNKIKNWPQKSGEGEREFALGRPLNKKFISWHLSTPFPHQKNKKGKE